MNSWPIPLPKSALRRAEQLAYRPKYGFYHHPQQHRGGRIINGLFIMRRELRQHMKNNSQCQTEKAKQELDKPHNFDHLTRSSTDTNGNSALLCEHECPVCKNSSSILWKDVVVHVLLADDGPGTVYLEDDPSADSRMMCSLCGHEGPFSEWGPHEVLNETQTPSYFAPGDIILSNVRKKGTGRDVIFDLYEFVAKCGTDKIIRWCRKKHPVQEHVRHVSSAKQVARLMNLQFSSVEIKHRQPVPTRQTIAMNALSTI